MKKILSILVMVLFGVGALYSQGSVTVYAYANVNTKSQSNLGGGQVQAHAASRKWTLASEWNSGTIDSSSSIVGYEARVTKAGPNLKVSYSADAYPDNGYYFSHWLNENGETLTGKEDAKNGIKDIEHSWVGSGNTNVHVYAIFKPVTVTGAGTVTNISTTDLGGVGTGTVTFNVANADNGNDFTSSIEGDAGFKIIEEPTWTDNVVTITIQYTDQNKHGTNIASTKVTLTSKGDPNSKATATIYATSNLTPTFTKPADYNYGTIYANDILSSEDKLHVITKNHAASQASPAATWTASLSGTNSNQFQLVNANPQYGVFEVIYKPTEVGTHTATLSISVTYTDAKGTTIPSEESQRVTLTGQAEQPTISAIVFNPTAVDFNEQVTGYTGSQKVTVSQQNVANVEYSWGETNAANVFSYAIAAGSVTISAKPTAPGNYNATLTATGDDTRNEYLGQQTTQTLNVSIAVGLQSPILQGGSNLKDTYYLKWNKIPHASTYNVYEVNGDTKSLILATNVADDETYITRSIASTVATKTYIIEAVGTCEGVEYKSWSNQVTLNLNTLTQTGTPYLDIYTGTNLTNLKTAGFASIGTVVPKKKVNLINTFDVNGKPLFDELYVFGETVSSDGNKTTMTAATTSFPNTAVTPCYVFTKTADGYELIPGENGGPTIGNVNQAKKQLPDTTDRCWTIAAGANKKLYFTGFCPFGSNGASKDDEGIIYIKGAAGAKVDVYLEDCQLYSRQHTPSGDAKGKESVDMPTFPISVRITGVIGGGAASSAQAAGSASAIVFECTNGFNRENPFRPTIHTIGNNVLYSQLGCTGLASFAGEEKRIGQYCASLQVRITEDSKDSYTVLSFDDKWPTDATNMAAYRRTNGYIRFQKSSGNSPSIELGNENTILNFNGGQIELQNSVPGAQYYLNTLAVCCRLGYAVWNNLTLFVGYGLGQDEVGGEVNFNDGTVNALPAKITNDAYKPYFDLDANGNTTTLRCPQKTYITGGSHNSDVRACAAVDMTGGSPKDKKGNTLVKLDYQLPGEAGISVDENTKLVKPNTMPVTLTCVGCGENGANTTLDLEHYGKESLCPDKDRYIHLWAPGAGRVEYNITSWVLSMTKVVGDYEGMHSVELGGAITVPASNTDKVNNLLYAQIDDNMFEVLDAFDPVYKIPGKVNEYMYADVKEHGDKTYDNIENTDPYTIHEKIYYVRVVNADEWIMFAPPFDISNVYVLETSSEADLETLTREEALKQQAGYNLDFASIFAAEIMKDMESNLNRTFNSHYDAYRVYARDLSNKQGKNYSADVKKIQIQPFTGTNYDANFFLYKSNTREWAYTDGAFATDWEIVSPITKKIGDVNRKVIMEKDNIYALQFPFCPRCEYDPETGEIGERDYWDYWTGKFIIFEGYGPQTIDGKNKSKSIEDLDYTTDNSGQLRGNPVFAEYMVSSERALFFDSYYDEYVGGDEFGSEEDLMRTQKAGGVYMVANLPEPSLLPGRVKSVDPETGDVHFESSGANGDNTTTSTPTILGNNQMMVYNIEGGVGIVPVVEQQVSIYNAAGQLVTSQYLTAETTISLPAGIYLISGEKEQAKVIVR